jgi:hypothetical protein
MRAINSRSELAANAFTLPGDTKGKDRLNDVPETVCNRKDL